MESNTPAISERESSKSLAKMLMDANDRIAALESAAHYVLSHGLDTARMDPRATVGSPDAIVTGRKVLERALHPTPPPASNGGEAS